MFSSPGFGFGFLGIGLIVLFYAVIVAVILLLLWVVIRSAVRRALRDHQEWLERRAAPPGDRG